MPITTEGVFVSSTYVDLKDYRAHVRDVIQRLGAIDIAMEKLGAVDERPLEECVRLIKEQSDLFVGIYAHKYGFIPRNESISITEAEYVAASGRGIPRMIFILDDDEPWKPALIDDGDNKSRLQKFLTQLRSNHVVERFSSPDDLGTKVALSVGKTLQQLSLQRVSPGNASDSQAPETRNAAAKESDVSRARGAIYYDCRDIFIAHTLRPSRQSGQKFDISIYLIRHKPDDPAKPFHDVAFAEFFFGKYWGNHVFKVDNDGGLIGLSTAAYGPFLCACKIHFKDGGSAIIYRYIDFEAAQSAR